MHSLHIECEWIDFVKLIEVCVDDRILRQPVLLSRCDDNRVRHLLAGGRLEVRLMKRCESIL